MAKVGLFFGSFNPVHNGHLYISEYFHRTYHLMIWYVLSPQSPFKEVYDLAPFLIRQKMLESAVQNMKQDYAHVVTVEMHFSPPYYTYHTLQYFLKKYPENEFILLMGEDNALNLDQWYRGDWIISNIKILSYPRRIVGKSKEGEEPPPYLPVSATEIRERIRKKLPVTDWLPIEVEKIIREEKLYLT